MSGERRNKAIAPDALQRIPRRCGWQRLSIRLAIVDRKKFDGRRAFLSCCATTIRKSWDLSTPGLPLCRIEQVLVLHLFFATCGSDRERIGEPSG
jgi:hypothetical protein